MVENIGNRQYSNGNKSTEIHMLENGYIYVLINPSMDGLVKIGRTSISPEERARQLSTSTGVPTPFVVVYSALFDDCVKTELFIHTYLEDKGFRLSKNREFFEIPVKEAIDAVILAKETFGEADSVISIENKDFFTSFCEPWEEVESQGDKFNYGWGDEIKSSKEAIACYLKAIKLGSVTAYTKIGEIYYESEDFKPNTTKAIEYIHKGAKEGDFDAYKRLAEIFEDKANIKNANVCWKKFFDATDNISELDLKSYIVFCNKNKQSIIKSEKVTLAAQDFAYQCRVKIDDPRGDKLTRDGAINDLRKIKRHFSDEIDPILFEYR